MEKLTAKQQKIYDYIQTFSAEHGYPLLSVMTARLWVSSPPHPSISI